MGEDQWSMRNKRRAHGSGAEHEQAKYKMCSTENVCSWVTPINKVHNINDRRYSPGFETAVWGLWVLRVALTITHILSNSIEINRGRTGSEYAG